MRLLKSRLMRDKSGLGLGATLTGPSCLDPAAPVAFSTVRFMCCSPRPPYIHYHPPVSRYKDPIFYSICTDEMHPTKLRPLRLSIPDSASARVGFPQPFLSIVTRREGPTRPSMGPLASSSWLAASHCVGEASRFRSPSAAMRKPFQDSACQCQIFPQELFNDMYVGKHVDDMGSYHDVDPAVMVCLGQLQRYPVVPLWKSMSVFGINMISTRKSSGLIFTAGM